MRLQGQPSATADVDGREIKTGTHDGRMWSHAGPQLPPRWLPKAAPWGGSWLTTGRQLADAVYSQAPDLDSPQKRNWTSKNGCNSDRSPPTTELLEDERQNTWRRWKTTIGKEKLSMVKSLLWIKIVNFVRWLAPSSRGWTMNEQQPERINNSHPKWNI